ncbi:MAG: sulfatase [Planctomycetota bacterium]
MKRLLAAAIWLVGAVSAAGAAPPNLIVFLVDDLGLMDTSVPMLTDEQGNPQRHPLNDWYRTPNLERFAADGVRFSNFYAQSVCSPTRRSLLTGQNAARHGTTTWINPATNNGGKHGPPDWVWRGIGQGEVTLPTLLQSAGYQTLFVGKAHLGPIGSHGEEPLRVGFDRNVGGCAWGRPESYYGQDGYGWIHPGVDGKPGGGVLRAVPHLEAYHGTETYLTEALTQESLRLLESAVAAGKPFFLELSHYAVHGPFHKDPRFVEHYAGRGPNERAEAFATMVEGMDKSLGDVLAKLRQLGVARDTLVVFLGDNGSDAPIGNQNEIACSAPLRGKKGSHYEGGSRVPCVIGWAEADSRNANQQAWPVASAGVQQQVATVMDLLPTLCEVAGVKPPAGHVVDGQSLAPQLTGKPTPGRRETFLLHFPHEHRSNYFTTYRDGDWKVAYHYFPSRNVSKKRYELFNLVDDPSESNNLAESRPEQLRAMMQNLADQLEAEGARLPVDSRGEPMRPIVPGV